MSDQVLHDIAYAMKRLGVSRATLDRLMDTRAIDYVDLATGVDAKRNIKGLRRNRVPRFLDADIDAFIDRRRVAATVPQHVAAVPERATGTNGPASRRRAPASHLQLAGAERYR